ncbi:substrate-binding domain-containing protein [Butyrivibrio sp. TB]|uniref:substrate-binding domain-containing protein n=1 Tax=Butyrivibrio sp. TB TaxID=1520809 RepID=UPI0008CD4828|nr:sugar-binding protein [Butyrivibrio sp. TB]SEQ58478.1 putative multiple sugar transport system substrate-binding protein [Butyrivibrio sp. TB]
MKKQLLKQALSLGMAAALLVGCSGGSTGGDTTGSGTDTGTENQTQQTDGGSDTGAADAGDITVGVSMPTKDLQRWNQDGANMQAELEAAGYKVDLQYASNDVQQQLSQVENMINNQVDVLVIAAIEGSSLGEALDMAKTAGIPVIAYDRLLMNSDAVSYYATFDNYMVGTVQGQYIIDELDLDNAEGPFNLEITAGDPGDNNAMFFYNGAMDLLKPYIESGKLVIQSGQQEFEDVATAVWATETAQSRAENILSSYYADGTNVDVWLCSNDSTALGVENALAANYNGEYPIVTGQDCDIENTKNMIADPPKQSMSVFKDTCTLASRVVKMVTQIVNGETVDVNDTDTYNNGVITVPSYLCEPVFADASNYKELLIDSGYYTEDQLK